MTNEVKNERIPGSPVSKNKPDIRWDLCGYPFNFKYPPNRSSDDPHPLRYHGYKTEVEEILFYDFAVQGYDLQFSYKGKMYYFGSFDGYVAETDEHFTKKYATFPHANALLEGRPIIDLIGELEDVEQM